MESGTERGTQREIKRHTKANKKGAQIDMGDSRWMGVAIPILEELHRKGA